MVNLFRLLTGSFLTAAILTFTLGSPALAQYVEQTTTFTGERVFHEAHQFMHPDRGTTLLCSADGILQDPISVQALENYRDLRRQQPEGALVMSLMEQYSVGDTRDFRVRNITNNTWNTVNFTLKALSERVRIWVELGEYGPDKVNDDVIDGLLTALDSQTPSLSINPNAGILDIHSGIFGTAPDIDGSGVLNVLITDIIDGWEPDSGAGSVGGFFDPVDLDPTNSNSNATDIIYLNSRPLIYFEDSINLVRVRSVASHEYQHLIHANYGALATFQNEGQSEWAELLTGYSGRVPNYFNNPEEINRELYSWRRGDAEVLFDYQRASMLHSYISQRVGPEATGSITRSDGGRFFAYETVAQQNGLMFEDILLDFHIANYVNDRNVQDGRYGYEDVRRRAYGVAFPTFQYFSGQTTGSGNRSVSYGAAEYIEWIGAEDLEVNISAEFEVSFAFITYPLDIEEDIEVFVAGSGSHTISGEYERIVLVAAGTSPPVETMPGAGLMNNGPRQLQWSYDSSWNTLPVIAQTLSYFGQVAAFAELPGTPGRPSREGIRRMAKRFSPEFDSRISDVNFVVNGRDSSLIGSDDLRISFHQAAGTPTNLRPGTEAGFITIPVNQVSRGLNRINVANQGWQMSGGGEYFIVFEVMSPNSRIEFLLDSGSEDQSDQNYFPARTRLFVEPPSSSSPGWFSYSNNNNLVASIRINGQYSGPLTAPVITSQPQNIVAPGGQDVTLSVGAEATPEPVYQWYKDGEPLYGENMATLTIESLDLSDEGEYTVRLSNPAGSVLSEGAQVLVSFDNFELVQNFPNPVRNQTTFRFIIPEESQISLDLFDVRGRRVATVVQSTTFQAGQHDVTFQPTMLASGVYYYQLRARATSSDNSFTKAMKMIRLR